MENKEKESLRRSLLRKRDQLPEHMVDEASRDIIELIRSIPEWKTCTEALLYWPIRGEVDLRDLVHELWDRKGRVLLPRCRSDAPGEMDLAYVPDEEHLKPGTHSIMEPDPDRCPPVASCSPSIMLVPGVAFDREGNRLGFGGGYYDRMLASGRLGQPMIIGVAYDFQVVDQLPVEPWDRPVDVICTEQELWRP